MLGKYDYEKCGQCGECLTHCPYVKLDEQQAREQIRLMREGKPGLLNRRCMGCMTCETVCSRDAHPYALVRAGWADRYDKKGLPVRARFMMPHSFPNFRTVVKLSRREKMLVEQWRKPKSADTALYAGCNTLVVPFLLDSPLFEDIPILGSYDLCCGEMYWRMGLWDEARKAAQKTAEAFKAMKIRRLVMVCMAGMNMFSNVYPREFGIDLGMEFQFVSDYLMEKFQAGALSFPNPINKKLAVQDSCHAKILGENYQKSPRKLLELAGVELVETEHAFNESQCCGVAGACACFSPFDILFSARKRFSEARKAGASGMVTYCNGCLLTMAAVGLFSIRPMPVYSMLQLVSNAAGYPVPNWSRSRAMRMLLGLSLHAMPRYLDPRRFRDIVK